MPRGPGQACEGVDPMGRGRAKAKQTKVARDLKYRTHETDFGALAKRAARRDRTDRPRPSRWSTSGRLRRSGRTTSDAPTRLTSEPSDVGASRSAPSRGASAALTRMRRRHATGPSMSCAQRGSDTVERSAQPDARAGGRPRASAARRAGRRRPPGVRRRRAASSNTCRVVSKIPVARCWARSKEKPSSSSATWISAAGVHAVVGRVEDAALLELLLDARVGELVVGRAADDLGAAAPRRPRR